MTTESKTFLEYNNYTSLQLCDEDLVKDSYKSIENIYHHNELLNENNESIVIKTNKKKENFSEAILDLNYQYNRSELNKCNQIDCKIEKHLNNLICINYESLLFDYAVCNLNNATNYSGYVSRVLKSLKSFIDLDLSKEIRSKRIFLPENSSTKKKTLIIDLDETLIYSEFESNQKVKKLNRCLSNPETIIHIKNENIKMSFIDSETSNEINFNVYLRPGVKDFLIEISKHFEVGIFTASIKEYANTIIDFLDPNKEIFSFRLFRESCIKIGPAYVKDLRIIQNRSLNSMIILDNSMYSFANQLSNGVLINSFYNESNDIELYNIFSYLTNYLLNSVDIRVINEEIFGFQSIFKTI